VRAVHEVAASGEMQFEYRSIHADGHGRTFERLVVRNVIQQVEQPCRLVLILAQS
jgi:hypothetical protein